MPAKRHPEVCHNKNYKTNEEIDLSLMHAVLLYRGWRERGGKLWSGAAKRNPLPNCAQVSAKRRNGIADNDVDLSKQSRRIFQKQYKPAGRDQFLYLPGVWVC